MLCHLGSKDHGHSNRGRWCNHTPMSPGGGDCIYVSLGSRAGRSRKYKTGREQVLDLQASRPGRGSGQRKLIWDRGGSVAGCVWRMTWDVNGVRRAVKQASLRKIAHVRDYRLTSLSVRVETALVKTVRKHDVIVRSWIGGVLHFVVNDQHLELERNFRPVHWLHVNGKATVQWGRFRLRRGV